MCRAPCMEREIQSHRECTLLNKWPKMRSDIKVTFVNWWCKREETTESLLDREVIMKRVKKVNKENMSSMCGSDKVMDRTNINSRPILESVKGGKIMCEPVECG